MRFNQFLREDLTPLQQKMEAWLCKNVKVGIYNHAGVSEVRVGPDPGRPHGYPLPTDIELRSYSSAYLLSHQVWHFAGTMVQMLTFPGVPNGNLKVVLNADVKGELPVQFGDVYLFDAVLAEGLTSIKGFPKVCHYHLSCNMGMPLLGLLNTEMKGNADFGIYDPKSSDRTKSRDDMGRDRADRTSQISRIFNLHRNKGRAGIMEAQDLLLEGGFETEAKF